MTGNPYYRMLGLMGADRLQLGLATLKSYDRELFQMESKQMALAGRARGLTIGPGDEGELFLCLGDRTGWYVLCRLEER